MTSNFTFLQICFISATPIEGGRRLLVTDADTGDTAKYKCVASNSVGIATKRYKVNVRGEFSF